MSNPPNTPTTILIIFFLLFDVALSLMDEIELSLSIIITIFAFQNIADMILLAA